MSDLRTSEFDQLPPADRWKLIVDFYKWRGEEYRNRYEGMRSLEWRILFQMYAGYAVIAVAFKYLHREENFQHPQLISLLAVAGTIVFYIAGRYLSFRIQERMIFFDKKYQSYIEEIHVLFGVGERGPDWAFVGHQYYWTYHTQLTLGTLTFFGLVAYEAGSGLPAPEGVTVFLIIGAATALGLKLGWKKADPRTPRPQEHERGADEHDRAATSSR